MSLPPGDRVKMAHPFDPPNYPRIVSITQRRKGNILLVNLELDVPLRRRFAPGGVFRQATNWMEFSHPPILEIHRFIEREGHKYSFESYKQERVRVPKGKTLQYVKSWWGDEELSLLHSDQSDWIRKKYPKPNDHDHCCLCWEKIAQYTEEGYELVSESWEEWMCSGCFHKYIVSGIGTRLGDSDKFVEDWRKL